MEQYNSDKDHETESLAWFAIKKKYHLRGATAKNDYGPNGELSHEYYTDGFDDRLSQQVVKMPEKRTRS